MKKYSGCNRSGDMVQSIHGTHDRGGSLPSHQTGFPEYIGREVALMTAYEILSIFIGIQALLISFGSFILALLTFLEQRNNKHK